MATLAAGDAFWHLLLHERLGTGGVAARRRDVLRAGVPQAGTCGPLELPVRSLQPRLVRELVGAVRAGDWDAASRPRGSPEVHRWPQDRIVAFEAPGTVVTRRTASSAPGGDRLTYSRTHRRAVAPIDATDRGMATDGGRAPALGPPSLAPAVTDARFIRDPAINEVKNLAAILPRQPVIIDEVVLVDGDSKDDTVAVTRAHLPNVRVVGQDPPGQGAAPLRHGFFALLSGPLVGHRARGRRFRDREMTSWYGHQGQRGHRRRAELRGRPDLRKVEPAHFP